MSSAINSLRFNRYMVECELESALSEALQDNGFNRYMVECELRIPYY